MYAGVPSTMPALRVSMVVPETLVPPHLEDLCNSEIQYLHSAVCRNHHISRLQVAMNNFLFVCRFERVRDLPANPQLADSLTTPSQPGYLVINFFIIEADVCFLRLVPA
jgi:hypothetical protein